MTIITFVNDDEDDDDDNEPDDDVNCNDNDANARELNMRSNVQCIHNNELIYNRFS